MKTQSTKPGFLILLLMLALSISSIAQRGDIIEENRYIDQFDAVSVSAGIDLYLTQSNKHSLKIVAEEEIMEHIITELNGDELVIKMNNNGSRSWWRNMRNTEPIKVYVSFQEIKYISASGGSDVHGETVIASDQLAIRGSGGSDIKLEIDATGLECNSSGGSDLYLSGKAATLEAKSSGGSDLNARDLVVQNCYLTSSGGSDAKVTVEGEIEVSASGASDAYIYGNPKVISRRASGASDIHFRN